MIKVLWWRFRQCFGSFNMLSVKGCSEMGLFKIDLGTSFTLGTFQNIKAMRAFFCSKYLKTLVFKKIAKKWEKAISFSDNYNWIGCKRSSLVQRKYLPWAFNVLTNSAKSSHVSNRDIFQLQFPESDKKYDKTLLM